MSQADADPIADLPPYTEPDPGQDVPEAFAPAPLDPPLDPPRPSAEETGTEPTSEGPTGQSEPAAQGRVVVCDQPVSLELEPEQAEEDVEVCRTCFWSISDKSLEHLWIFAALLTDRQSLIPIYP